MSANTSFLHRLHRGLARPATVLLGPVRLELRAYYFLPVLALSLVTGGFRFSGQSHDEIMTYRGGWGLGGIAKDADRATQKDTLE